MTSQITVVTRACLTQTNLQNNPFFASFLDLTFIVGLFFRMFLAKKAVLISCDL